MFKYRSKFLKIPALGTGEIAYRARLHALCEAFNAQYYMDCLPLLVVRDPKHEFEAALCKVVVAENNKNLPEFCENLFH